MKRIEKVMIAMVLATALFMTGIIGMSSAQDNRNRNGNANTTSNTGTAMTLTAADSDFANMAAQGSAAEIQMAELAIQRSKNKDVMKYARRMVKDHTKASRDLDKIATRKGMTLTRTPNSEQMQMMDQLRGASDADFDMTYIRIAGVEAHQTMLTLFQNQAGNGSDADLKRFASKTLPTVQTHLRMAQEMMNGGMNTNGNMNGNMNRNMNGNMNGNMNSNMNTNMNMNSNMNSNMDMNSNMGGNGNMNDNRNMNRNMNRNTNDNGNMNGNMNRNMNGNGNMNRNRNMNSNTNRNTNDNGNMNGNMNGNGNMNSNRRPNTNTTPNMNR